ncbi:hypothetical protein V1279_003122 [Bradyrhizobium sp. AZCC 1610]|uniref:hypothetical protein n=1 Tax=Bradyrhizobium sp. AZCC 1610 TaxID=3117020 RepID=UPI002FF2D60A
MISSEDERQLWCAVIAQAIDDAICAVGKSRRRNMEIMGARDWLTKPNRDFAEVCRLAGYEPDRIRAQVSKRIDQVLPLDCPAPPKPRKPRRSRRSTTNESQEANVSRP